MAIGAPQALHHVVTALARVILGVPGRLNNGIVVESIRHGGVLAAMDRREDLHAGGGRSR